MKIVAVACGAGHSVVLTDQGAAYAWGLGMNGQLGLAPAEDDGGEPELANSAEPRRMDSLRQLNITGVACGFAHTMLVDDKGTLFACGWNNQGQAGVPEEKFNLQVRSGNVVPKPRRVDHLSKRVRDSPT